MRVLCRTAGAETRRKHLAEQYAQNLIRYKEKLMKTDDYPQKQNMSRIPPRTLHICKMMQNSDKHWKKQTKDVYQRRTENKKSLLRGETKRDQERDKSQSSTRPSSQPSSC